MKDAVYGLFFAILLLVPASAFSQSSDRITLLGNFGEFDKGESLFIYGKLATVQPDSFLILEIINPKGDLCQIQQLMPLTSGDFITDVIPLKGRVCGLPGEYEIKLFYGDYPIPIRPSVARAKVDGSGTMVPVNSTSRNCVAPRPRDVCTIKSMRSMFEKEPTPKC